MTVCVVCSCGVLIRGRRGVLLIDLPNDACNQFAELPEAELQKILRSEYPYDLPLCIAFTHLHPDHYSERKLHAILDVRPNTEVVLPADKPQTVRVHGGEFRIESYPSLHVRAPGFDNVVHNVVWIEGEKSVYLTADALCDWDAHRAVLGGRRADFAFWNNQYLSYPLSRALLHDAAKENYIYHIPVDAEDQTGMRRKAVRALERHADELLNTKLILSYPSVIESDA